MNGGKVPSTKAVLALQAKGVNFKPHFYRYVKSGTGAAAKELGVEEHLVIKTLVMESDKSKPFIVLMHGDRLVSTKSLARAIKAKSVRPVDPKVARRMTGYTVGGISPFGTRRKMPVYMEKTILTMPGLYINGGRRGLILELSPQDLVKVLDPVIVDVAR